MMDMNIEEARYIICNVYESYRRLMHLPPNFLEREVLKDKSLFKSKIARCILTDGVALYDDVIKPILSKFPELEDELEIQKQKEFNMLPCKSLEDSHH